MGGFLRDVGGGSCWKTAMGRLAASACFSKVNTRSVVMSSLPPDFGENLEKSRKFEFFHVGKVAILSVFRTGAGDVSDGFRLLGRG